MNLEDATKAIHDAAEEVADIALKFIYVAFVVGFAAGILVGVFIGEAAAR